MKKKIHLFLVKLLSKLLYKLTPHTGLPTSRSKRQKGIVDFKEGDDVYLIDTFQAVYLIDAFQAWQPPRFVRVIDIVYSNVYGSGVGVAFKQLGGEICYWDASWFWSKSEIDRLNKNHTNK
jgi:hypothetical protein